MRKKNKSYVYNFSLLTSNYSFICTSVPLCCFLRDGLFIKLSIIFSSLILELFSSLLVECSNLNVRNIAIIHDPDLDSCARNCKTCKLYPESDQVWTGWMSSSPWPALPLCTHITIRLEACQQSDRETGRNWLFVLSTAAFYISLSSILVYDETYIFHV